MKLLLVTGIFPPDIGGPASYVPVVAGVLAGRGHEVRVLTTSEPEHLDHDDGIYPFPVVRINRRWPLRRRTLSCVTRIVHWGRQADVIYGNGIFPELALANRRLRKPLVMKIVGDYAWERATNKGWTQDDFETFQRRANPWRVELLKRLRAWHTRSADTVIVPSLYLRGIVAGWGVPGERIVTVYNAVEGLNAAPSSTRPPAASDGAVRLLTIARLVPWKGVDSLIRVLPRLPRATLMVVGEGPCRAAWCTLASEKGVADRVNFAGSLAHERIPSLMAGHDLFVLASKYEGLPHVVVEAMLQGLPVVATRVGGTPEVVEHGVNGLLAEPEDESLYQALYVAVNDSALRGRLAAQAPGSVGAKFSFQTMIDETERVLIASRRPQA